MKYLFLILTFVTACACRTAELVEKPADVSTHPLLSPSSMPTPAGTPAPEKIDSGLQADLKKIAEAANGRVGVGAVLLETGESAYLDRKGQYPMQSVYKLPIAMAVLKMVDEGKVRIDQEVAITPDDFVRQGFHSPIRNANPQGVVMPIGEIIRFSISESDGTASDVLLDLAGGPIQVQRYLAFVGNGKEMIVTDSEKSISKDWETQYRNWSAPEASIQLLRALHERQAGLSEQTTSMLLRFMTETETGDRRIKRALPAGSSLAHKTGTGGTEKGITSATNDIGIVTLPDGRHILLAIFVSDSPADVATREKVIADIAGAVIERWTLSETQSEPVGNSIDFNLRHSVN